MPTEDKCAIIIAMLEELKSGNKNQKAQQMDFSKIESLSEKLESSINATSDTTTKMERIMEEVRKPIIRERRITIDIVSKEITFLLSKRSVKCVLLVICFGLSFAYCYGFS